MKKQLPKNWEDTELENLFNLIYGKGLSVNELTEDGYDVYGANGIIGKFTDYLYEKSKVIISCRGAASGAIHKTNPKSFITSNSIVLNEISSDLINLNFIKYVMTDADKSDVITGTAQPQITIQLLKNLKIPLPPLLEQNRIVEKLDTLFAQLETIKTNMANIPLLLKDFRQQVLTQAVTGKLTEEWRKGKKLKVWQNVELNRVIPKGGIFDGPFGSNLKTEDYIDQGVRVVRLENIEHLGFIGNKETYVSVEKHQKLIRHTVVEGDIIFSSFISENIRACILPKLKTKAIAKADCFCIRPDETIIDKKFLLYILVSNITYSQLTSHIHGATRPRINTTQLKTIRIPLVSLKEQEEIVRRVESLFAKADAIEQQYKSLKEKIDTLPQALLHKAFKGELTEQLDSDGDARELLKQIQELKGATTKVTKNTKLEKLKEFNRKIKSYRENDGVLGMVAEK